MENAHYIADWLYMLIFKEIESWCKCLDSESYYLIEEYSDDDGSDCKGEIIRAWIRDKQGMNEITIEELSVLKKKRRETYTYFFEYECLACFHIHPDRQRVVWGWRDPYIVGGTGGRYRVVGQFENATLEPDGGGWIS